FLKAAEMGSPWAMAMLFPGKGSKCEYLGWKCDDRWGELAISEWEKLAENGNGNALLQLQFYQGTWRKYIPFLGRYLINEKYIEALYNGSNNAAQYLYQHSGLPINKRIKYLLVAANRGYAPAMVNLYYHEDFIGSDEANKWIDKAITLGYPKAAESLFYNYHLRREKNKNDIKKSYYYNLVLEALGGDAKDKESIIMEIVRVDGSLVLDEDGDFVYRTMITKKEQDELNRQVEEFVKDIKINLFLDETSIELL
ncbi:hypothetical protein, partial [Vibrio nigripulchritudo]|uniref:hypothetical protein n=1 Tax=Vibrio nigripulchritudo TaxID=28173 RepID=UPI0007E4FD5C